MRMNVNVNEFPIFAKLAIATWEAPTDSIFTFFWLPCCFAPAGEDEPSEQSYGTCEKLCNKLCGPKQIATSWRYGNYTLPAKESRHEVSHEPRFALVVLARPRLKKPARVPDDCFGFLFFALAFSFKLFRVAPVSCFFPMLYRPCHNVEMVRHKLLLSWITFFGFL